MATCVERAIGLALGIAAVLWAAYHLASAHAFHPAFLRLGPMQLFMGGLLLWVHGRYRAVHFTRIRRDDQARFRDF